MKLADFARLKKFMALTTSDNDHEALSALKMANLILHKEKLTWERVLDRTVQIVPEVEDGPNPEDRGNPHRHGSAPSASAADITEAFRVLDGADLGNFQDFIDSLRDQWQRQKFLSPKQRDALFRAADKERSR